MKGRKGTAASMPFLRALGELRGPLHFPGEAVHSNDGLRRRLFTKAAVWNRAQGKAS